MKAPIIIAEIGCYHNGDMAIVKEISQSADMQVGRGFSLEKLQCNKLKKNQIKW